MMQTEITQEHVDKALGIANALIRAYGLSVRIHDDVYSGALYGLVVAADKFQGRTTFWKFASTIVRWNCITAIRKELGRTGRSEVSKAIKRAEPLDQHEQPHDDPGYNRIMNIDYILDLAQGNLRTQNMLLMYAVGYSQDEIGIAHSISTNRVSTIFKRCGGAS